jgi:hypothetical protein
VLLPPGDGSARFVALEAAGQALLAEAQRGYGRVLREVMTIAGPRAIPPPADLDFPRLSEAGQALVASRRAMWRRTRQRLVAAAGGERAIPAVLSGCRLERDARKALDAVVAAFNHLEDNDLAVDAHRLAHAIGELVGGLFGCYMKREGSAGSMYAGCR